MKYLRNLPKQELAMVYRQFSRQKYNKYRHQFPRMRQSQLVSKIIKQWEGLNLQQKKQLSVSYRGQRYIGEKSESSKAPSPGCSSSEQRKYKQRQNQKKKKGYVDGSKNKSSVRVFVRSSSSEKQPDSDDYRRKERQKPKQFDVSDDQNKRKYVKQKQTKKINQNVESHVSISLSQQQMGKPIIFKPKKKKRYQPYEKIRRQKTIKRIISLLQQLQPQSTQLIQRIIRYPQLVWRLVSNLDFRFKSPIESQSLSCWDYTEFVTKRRKQLQNRFRTALPGEVMTLIKLEYKKNIQDAIKLLQRAKIQHDKKKRQQRRDKYSKQHSNPEEKKYYITQCQKKVTNRKKHIRKCLECYQELIYEAQDNNKACPRPSHTWQTNDGESTHCICGEPLQSIKFVKQAEEIKRISQNKKRGALQGCITKMQNKLRIERKLQKARASKAAKKM